MAAFEDLRSITLEILNYIQDELTMLFQRDLIILSDGMQVTSYLTNTYSPTIKSMM